MPRLPWQMSTLGCLSLLVAGPGAIVTTHHHEPSSRSRVSTIAIAATTTYAFETAPPSGFTTAISTTFHSEHNDPLETATGHDVKGRWLPRERCSSDRLLVSMRCHWSGRARQYNLLCQQPLDKSIFRHYDSLTTEEAIAFAAGGHLPQMMTETKSRSVRGSCAVGYICERTIKPSPTDVKHRPSKRTSENTWVKCVPRSWGAQFTHELRLHRAAVRARSTPSIEADQRPHHSSSSTRTPPANSDASIVGERQYSPPSVHSHLPAPVAASSVSAVVVVAQQITALPARHPSTTAHDASRADFVEWQDWMESWRQSHPSTAARICEPSSSTSATATSSTDSYSEDTRAQYAAAEAWLCHTPRPGETDTTSDSAADNSWAELLRNIDDFDEAAADTAVSRINLPLEFSMPT